jgi:hypothetical protein
MAKLFADGMEFVGDGTADWWKDYVEKKDKPDLPTISLEIEVDNGPSVAWIGCASKIKIRVTDEEVLIWIP